MTFRAVYLPQSNNPPVGKGGFKNSDAAWEWILENRICSECKKEYDNFKNGVEEDYEKGIFSSAMPACACEWLVYDEDEEAEEEWNKNGGETIMSLDAYKYWYKRQLELEDERKSQ